MKLFAHLVSFIFNPLFFFLVMPYIVVYKQTSDSFYALKWWIFSLAFIVSAGILLVLSKRRKIISDYDLSNKDERAKFYIVLCLLGFTYLFLSLFFKGIYFPLSIMASGIFFALIVFMLTNKYVKSSVHVAVTCAFVITLNVLFKEKVLMIAVLLVPLVAWSRLFLKRHTLSEVLVGGLLGTVITVATFLFGKYLYAS